MSNSKKIVAAKHSSARGTQRSYVIGFALSILLTVIPFTIVVADMVNGLALIVLLIGFALAQLLVQLKFFIHLGEDTRPRWNSIMFMFMMLVVFIVVVGSLWIMSNLDYNMMHKDVDKYLMDEENIHKESTNY